MGSLIWGSWWHAVRRGDAGLVLWALVMSTMQILRYRRRGGKD